MAKRHTCLVLTFLSFSDVNDEKIEMLH